MKPIFVVLLLAVTLPGGGTAGETPSLQDLEWIAGRWQGTSNGIDAEEVWMLPRAGSMLGMHRDIKGDRTVSFEFLRIEQTNGQIDYVALPQGRQETRFRLIELSARRVVFSNQAHDYPQRIIYWLSDDGALQARVEGTIKGVLQGEEWRWVRAQ